jgi:DNA-binding transcriptional ArsR family regulator
MRTKSAALGAIRLLAHPIAFRILLTLGARGQLTTEQISAALSDVPISTLYRHLRQLRDVGLVSVIEERQARGTVERTYAVVASKGVMRSAVVQGVPIARVRATIRNFIANLTANVLAYVESRAFSKDRSQLRAFLAAADLTDEEYSNVIGEIINAISTANKRSAGAATKRRSFYVIALPQASAP